jgi:hypothetical protein
MKEGVLTSSQKKVLPVNIDEHWSLCAVYSAAQIATFDETNDDQVEIPCLLFLDTLDFHSKNEVCKNIRDWLNVEWNKKHNTSINMFTALTMKSVSPTGKYVKCVHILYKCTKYYSNILFTLQLQYLSKVMQLIAVYTSASMHLHYTNFVFGQ